jgi:hypothetical protein
MVKYRDRERHPGPMKFMPTLGGEAPAIILAIGFVVMGLVGVPLAKVFLVGAIVLGIGVATLLHFLRK